MGFQIICPLCNATAIADSETDATIDFIDHVKQHALDPVRLESGLSSKFMNGSSDLEELDRVARAYGFEVGRGNTPKEIMTVSIDNPFMYPNWRDRIVVKD